MLRTIVIVVAAASLTACPASRAAPSSTASLSTQADVPAFESDYRISAQDILNVRVFQVEDLSFDELRVGTSGLVEQPLIGSARAAGRTPSELAAEIRDRLADRYMHDPQVTVSVTESSSQKITVDGAVTEAGGFGR